MSTTETAPAPAAPKQRQRDYLVLRKDVAGMWEEQRTVKAANADEACLQVAELIDATGHSIEVITLVAVVARRFKPRPIAAKTQTRLTFVD